LQVFVNIDGGRLRLRHGFHKRINGLLWRRGVSKEDITNPLQYEFVQRLANDSNQTANSFAIAMVARASVMAVRWPELGFAVVATRPKLPSRLGERHWERFIPHMLGSRYKRPIRMFGRHQFEFNVLLESQSNSFISLVWLDSPHDTQNACLNAYCLSREPIRK
jgi:hypothetical protein